MSDVERILFDTYGSKAEADSNLSVYAALLVRNGLTDRFGVSVSPDFERDAFGRINTDRPTWSIVLTDRHPNVALPAFLRKDNFQLKRLSRERSSQPSASPSAEDWDEEEDDDSPPVNRFPKGALYDVHGASKTLPEWARDAGINYSTLMARLRNGASLEEALTRPSHQRRK